MAPNERRSALRFRDLLPGQTFDFVDDARPGLNSYFERCMKTGQRTYVRVSEQDDNVTVWTDATGEAPVMRVGTISVDVYHVGASAVREPVQ